MFVISGKLDKEQSVSFVSLRQSTFEDNTNYTEQNVL